jgi:U4/U6.U5 tri-snRNP-associated protein 1
LSKESTPPPAPSISNNATSSETLSIDETNKLRIKLGLKPLKVEDGAEVTIPKKTAEELMGGKDMGEFVHRAPENWGAKKKAEKLREKIRDRKDKRAIDAKLKAVKGIADESSDDDAYSWVKKSRKIEDEKAKAAKRVILIGYMSIFMISIKMSSNVHGIFP